MMMRRGRSQRRRRKGVESKWENERGRVGGVEARRRSRRDRISGSRVGGGVWQGAAVGQTPGTAQDAIEKIISRDSTGCY
jgi:hypothetical protein